MMVKERKKKPWFVLSTASFVRYKSFSLYEQLTQHRRWSNFCWFLLCVGGWHERDSFNDENHVHISSSPIYRIKQRAFCVCVCLFDLSACHHSTSSNTTNKQHGTICLTGFLFVIRSPIILPSHKCSNIASILCNEINRLCGVCTKRPSNEIKSNSIYEYKANAPKTLFLYSFCLWFLALSELFFVSLFCVAMLSRFGLLQSKNSWSKIKSSFRLTFAFSHRNSPLNPRISALARHV